MGIFSIIVGIILIIAFIFGGYAAACALVMPGFSNLLAGGSVNMGEFFSLPTASNWYYFVVCIVIGVILGLQIGLGLVMSGMNYNRISRLERLVYYTAKKDDDDI